MASACLKARQRGRALVLGRPSARFAFERRRARTSSRAWCRRPSARSPPSPRFVHNAMTSQASVADPMRARALRRRPRRRRQRRSLRRSRTRSRASRWHLPQRELGRRRLVGPTAHGLGRALVLGRRLAIGVISSGLAGAGVRARRRRSTNFSQSGPADSLARFVIGTSESRSTAASAKSCGDNRKMDDVSWSCAPLK